MPTRLVDLKTNKLFDKGQSSSSSVQSKQSYIMKAPKTFAQAVDPAIGKTTATTPPIKEEFKFVTTQEAVAIALDVEELSMKGDVDVLGPPILNSERLGVDDVEGATLREGTGATMSDDEDELQMDFSLDQSGGDAHDLLGMGFGLPTKS
ncbi:hypothetical protein FXO38_29980 [Capsicum annuum]|nr:hypothetical protein FXO38_29980 [Capsicum annuum]